MNRQLTGFCRPKPVPAQFGLNGGAGAEMAAEGDALALSGAAVPSRAGWAEAAKRIAEAGDDELVMGEFGNVADADLAW